MAGGVGAFVEDFAEPPVALGGAPGALFAAGDVVPRAQPGPRRQVGGGGELGHVDTDLGDDALGRALADTGDRVEPIAGFTERGDHPVDFTVEVGDRRFQVVDVIEDDPQHRGVMLPEPAPEGQTQRRDLLAQHPFGQLGERVRITFPGDEGPQHGPARHPQHVGGHRVELDPGVLQDLLHPLTFGGVGLDQPFAVPGQVTQLPDRSRRHERSSEQPMLQQLRQPGRVGHVSLAARHHLDVLGVDQLEVKVPLFEHVPDRLPVGAGRFHHDLDDPVGTQPVSELLKARGERQERARLRRAAPPRRRRCPHTTDDLVLADIETSATLDKHFHQSSLPHR